MKTTGWISQSLRRQSILAVLAITALTGCFAIGASDKDPEAPVAVSADPEVVEPEVVEPEPAAPTLPIPTDDEADEAEAEEAITLRHYERSDPKTVRWYHHERSPGDPQAPSHPQAGPPWERLSPEESLRYLQALYQSIEERPQWTGLFDLGFTGCIEPVRAWSLPAVDDVKGELVAIGFHDLASCCQDDLELLVASSAESDRTLRVLDYRLVEDVEYGCAKDTSHEEFIFERDGDELRPVSSLVDWTSERPSDDEPMPDYIKLVNVITLPDESVGFVLYSSWVSSSGGTYHDGHFLARYEGANDPGESGQFRIVNETVATSSGERFRHGVTLRLYEGSIFFDDVDVPTSEPITLDDELVAVGDEQIQGDWKGYQKAFEALFKKRTQVTVTLQRGDETREVILGVRQ